MTAAEFNLQVLPYLNLICGSGAMVFVLFVCAVLKHYFSK